MQRTSSSTEVARFPSGRIRLAIPARASAAVVVAAAAAAPGIDLSLETTRLG